MVGTIGPKDANDMRRFQVPQTLLLVALGVNVGVARADSVEGVTARLVADVSEIQPGKPFLIGLLFDVPKNHYFYYQSPGSIGLPTKVKFTAPKGFTVDGPLFPTPVVKYAMLGDKLAANNIYKKSTAILARVTPPTTPATGSIQFQAHANYQWCEEDKNCVRREYTGRLGLAWSTSGSSSASAEAPALEAARRALPDDRSPIVSIDPSLEPTSLAPGQAAVLRVALTIAPGWHLQMNRPPVASMISTDLILDDVPGLKKFPVPTYPKPSPPVKPLAGSEGIAEYRGRVVIEVPITASDRLTGPEVTLRGRLRFQACSEEGTCLPPTSLSWKQVVPVTSSIHAVSAIVPSAPVSSPPSIEHPASTTSGAAAASSALADLMGELKPVETGEVQGSLWQFLFYAFLGGMILNVMPCVLPVIAIKVLGFVQQAGESRWRVFQLNLAYSGGVLFVFLILATLAITAGLGWGGLFQKPGFNVAMAGIVFAMGLSLLGVFDIPAPGFVGSRSGGAPREGVLGAFFTGILATLLATPCSGPFLGVTLAWSLRQAPPVTFGVWSAMGLGMAFPYLLLGCFPAAIKLLPKPGDWMIRFKEAAGIILMGTVVYIIWFLDDRYTIPVLVMLVGLTIAFWMIGSLYDWSSSLARKRVIRASALSIAAGVTYFGMTWVKDTVEDRHERKIAQEIDRRLSEMNRPGVAKTSSPPGENAGKLAWQPFSTARLVELTKAGTTVLVDFTADWCLTCKTNEAVAINTKATKALFDELGAVALYADYTAYSDDVKNWLDKLGSTSVPLTAVFPGNDPSRPIILRDLFGQQALLDALRKAGPSLSKKDAPATASR